VVQYFAQGSFNMCTRAVGDQTFLLKDHKAHCTADFLLHCTENAILSTLQDNKVLFYSNLL